MKSSFPVKRIFGTHPAFFAFLLGGGAFLMLYFGYNLLFPAESVNLQEMDTDLVVGIYWALCALGIFMWLAGGVAFGRNRGFSGFTAFFTHLLLPVLGLILMAVIKRPLTPHEAWARDNPGLDTSASRRTYRPMKPLY